MQWNCYEWKTALIKISGCYTVMELFRREDFTREGAVFVFSCRILKTGLQFLKTMMSQYQKRKQLLRFQTKTDTSGRTKAIQKRRMGTENFWKTKKQLLCFQTKMDTSGRGLIVETWTQSRDWGVRKCEICTWQLLGFQGWAELTMQPAIFDSSWLANETSYK